MDTKPPVSRKIAKLLFMAGFAIVLVLGIMNVLYEEPFDEVFMQEFDQFNEWEQVNSDPLVFSVSQDGTQVGYLAFDEHYGYQSDIVMGTLVGLDGVVLQTSVYQEDETPAYIRKLVGAAFYKNNFIGDSIEQGFSVDTNVDAVTKATISSNAVANAVEKSVSYVGENYLDIEVIPANGDTIKVTSSDFVLLGMFVLAIAATRFPKLSWLQWVTRIYSVVMLGFVIAQFITLSVLVAFFSFEWPSLVDYLRWYIMIFGVLALLLITGKNSYCSHMCPFGAFQEIEAAFAGSLCKTNASRRIAAWARYIPGVLLFVAVVLAFVTHDMIFLTYEPFSLLFGQVGEGVHWALLPIVLVASIFFKRFYCRYACPVGYVLRKIVSGRNKVVNKIGRKREKHEEA